MSNVKKVARNKIKKCIFSSMFVISLVFLMIAVSFSWFTNGKKASVSGITVQTVEANNLEVMSERGTWTKVADMPIDEEFKFSPVTGDGKSFFTPLLKLGVLDGQPNVLDFKVAGYEGIKEGEYAQNGIYETTFTFRVENTKALCLGMGSSVVPADLNEHSAYGDYSNGYICGAVRIAFYQVEGGNEVLKCIWIPNSTVHLDVSGNTSLNIDPETAVVESEYVFSHSNPEQKTRIITNGEASGSQIIDGVVYFWGDLGSDKPLMVIEGNKDLTVKMIVWVEGTDREAHNALVDGRIYMNLEFNVAALAEE